MIELKNLEPKNSEFRRPSGYYKLPVGAEISGGDVMLGEDKTFDAYWVSKNTRFREKHVTALNEFRNVHRPESNERLILNDKEYKRYRFAPDDMKDIDAAPDDLMLINGETGEIIEKAKGGYFRNLNLKYFNKEVFFEPYDYTKPESIDYDKYAEFIEFW